MTTAYTTLLGLALPVQGELQGTWGDEVNNYITNYLDAAVAGTQTISGSQTAVTLSKTTGSSLSQAGSGATGSSQYFVINCTGNPAGTLTITAPAASKAYLIINATSTTQDVKIVGAGPTTGVTLVSGERAIVSWNGSDFVKVANFGGVGSFTTISATTGNITTVNSTTVDTTNIEVTNIKAKDGTASASIADSTGAFSVSAAFAANGNTTLGDAVGDLVTVNGTTTFVNANPTLSAGAANGVLYLDGSKVATSGSALTFDGTGALALANTGNVISTIQSTSTGGVRSATLRLNVASAGGDDPAGTISFTYGTGFTQAAAIDVTHTNPAMKFLLGASEQMRLTSTGLGIGTSSPSSAYSGAARVAMVAATGTTVASLRVSSANASAELYSAGSVTEWGLYSASNSPFSIWTNNNKNLTLDTSGNLGLGVTPSAWGAGSQALQNGGGAVFQYNNDRIFLGQNTYIDSAFGDRFIGNGYATRYRQYQGTHAFYVSTVSNSSGAGASQSLTQAMTLDASGNLQVGTSSGTFINGKGIVIADATAARLKLADTDAGVGTSNGLELGFGGAIGSIYNLENGALLFGTNNTERARITSGGNFKIGGTADRATTEGDKQLVLFDGTAPVGTLANGVSFYSASGEANVMDAAGNATLLSPHDAETNEWIFRSKHTPTGKVLKIDVERLLKFVNDHFGLDAVHEFIEP